MAVNTRLSAPNYKIFEPDALDAIYSKELFNPLEGGIAYAFHNAHNMENAENANRALDAQDKFNRMAAGLDAMDIAHKTKQEALKIGGNLIEHGEDPTNILGSDAIYANPAGSLLPGLQRGLLSAKTAAEYAKAAADRSAGVDTTKTTSTDLGTGVTTEVTHKGKAGNVAIPTQTNAPDPTSSTPIPDANANRPSAQASAYAQKVIAAVGTDKPTVNRLPNGTIAYTNPSTKTTAIFDPRSGNQVRQ